MSEHVIAIFPILFQAADRLFSPPVLAVVLGTIAFGHITYRRSVRDARRQESIKFIEETAASLNAPLSLLYASIRNRKYGEEIRQATGVLFTKRLSVRVKSHAYIDSQIFWEEYDKIVWELRRIDENLKRIVSLEIPDECSHYVNDRIQQLRAEWEYPPPPDDILAEPDRGLPHPYSEMIVWINLVWKRSHELLSNALIVAISM